VLYLILAAILGRPVVVGVVSMSDDARARRRASQMTIDKSGGYRESIDGRKTPELYFRHELFDTLASAICPLDKRAAARRASYAAGLTSLGIEPSAFWRHLSDALGSYVPPGCGASGVDRHNGPRTAVSVKSLRGDSVVIHVSLSSCRARAAAITAAQKAIGKETLDKVLYSIVATNLQSSFFGTDKERVEQLRYIEGGCR